MHVTPPADWRRRAEALGSLSDASGELPAGHRRSHRAIDRARLSTERGYRQSEVPPRSSSGSSGSSCRTRAGLQLEATPAGLSRRCSEASSSVTPLTTTHMLSDADTPSDRLLRNHRVAVGDTQPPMTVLDKQFGRNTAGARTRCLSPPELHLRRAHMAPAGGASCSSEHSHDTPTAQCVQWCKPSDQHCARAHQPPPALRAHACVAHTTRPGAGACQVRGASAEAAMGVSSGRRRRAACCLRHRRSSHAARRR